MNRIQTVVPISDLRLRHVEVLGMSEREPVILAQRSKPTAVIVGIELWNGMADEHDQLQRAHAALLAQIASIPGGTDWDEVKADMKARGLL